MPRDLRLNPPIPALFPERDALLAAVRDADPADDLPALVYADWQDEHGQPEHAELIRVMVELAKAQKKDATSKARRSQLLLRMKELFKTPALVPLRELEPNTSRFMRGFVREVIVTWMTRPKDTGFVRRTLGGLPHSLDVPAVLPFDKVAWLWVKIDGNAPATESVAALAGQPWLRRAGRLVLQQYGGGSIYRYGTLLPLAESEYLGGLRGIEVWGGLISASDVVALHLARSATSLRTFQLAQWQGRVYSSEVRRSHTAFLSAVEQIVSSNRARQFTSFGDSIADGGSTVDVDEALAKILLASKNLGGIHTFRYVVGKITAKTRAAFAERFGPPERAD